MIRLRGTDNARRNQGIAEYCYREFPGPLSREGFSLSRFVLVGHVVVRLGEVMDWWLVADTRSRSAQASLACEMQNYTGFRAELQLSRGHS